MNTMLDLAKPNLLPSLSLAQRAVSVPGNQIAMYCSERTLTGDP
jgi:hypothetical protein